MEDVQSIRTAGVLFLGEQDGPAEQLLKERLIKTFGSFPSIKAAYLVRISYRKTPGISVSLCLHGASANAVEIVRSAGADFKVVFNATQHLDIAFLSEAQISLIERVAKPFYTCLGVE